MDQFVIAAEVSNQAFDAPLYEEVIGTAKTNLKRAGEKRRLRRVVADAGYWSEHNTQLRGVDSFIAPGRARKLAKIAETEQRRSQVIDQVQAGELTKPEAAEKLGVSVPRINQILRRRRAGDPDQLTAASIAKIDSPRGRRTYGSDLRSVMERMGHAQIQTTQKYLHALPGADQRNLDALDRMTHRRG